MAKVRHNYDTWVRFYTYCSFEFSLDISFRRLWIRLVRFPAPQKETIRWNKLRYGCWSIRMVRRKLISMLEIAPSAGSHTTATDHPSNESKLLGLAISVCLSIPWLGTSFEGIRSVLFYHSTQASLIETTQATFCSKGLDHSYAAKISSNLEPSSTCKFSNNSPTAIP